MTSAFVPSEAAIARLVQAYPLCWVLSRGADVAPATPLPLLAEADEAGGVRALFGHMARANPLCAALEADPRATVLATGPQGYISPRLLSDPTWGPTWNYAVCRFEVEIQFVPDENDAALWRLAASLEGTGADAWTPERMGDRYEQLKPRIVAFRAHVRRAHARFKLGQDENDTAFGDIVEGLADRNLAEWMIRARG